MAFDGHQGTLGNSLFSTYKRQDSVNVGDGGNGGVTLPLATIPSVPLQEQTTASYTLWSHNAHDDPYDLISCSQNRVKSRKNADSHFSDGETDLQGLVSNILNEADSQESYFSEGTLPTFNPIWSTKTLRGELPQYFQSEAKMQHQPPFPQNYVSREKLSAAQGQSGEKDVEDVYQQSNGLPNNREWLFSFPNGEKDGYTHRSPKLPPGLPMPKTGNGYLSQTPRNRYDNMPAKEDKGTSQPINNLPDLSNVFRPQIEMNSKHFHPYYADQYIQNSNEQYGPQVMNQLVSNFQSFMAGEHNDLCHEDFPNIQRLSSGTHCEDSMVEQWTTISPAVPTQTPAMQAQKQLMGEIGTMDMKGNGGARKQTFKHDAFHDLAGFSPQNTEYFLPSRPSSTSLNFSQQYHNNMSVHKENTLFPINASMSQYSKHDIQQSKLQTQREKKRTHVSGSRGDCFSARSLTNTNMREGDKKHALSPNPSVDHLGSLKSLRFDGENGMVSAGNKQQLGVPFKCRVNDPRRLSSVPVHSSNFGRSSLKCGSGEPGVDLGDVMSANKSAVFNNYVSDMLTSREEGTYHAMASPIRPSLVMNQGGLVMQLNFYLDKCYVQWRLLASERKRTEVILNKTFLVKRTPQAAANTNLPKTPSSPTRVEQLIVNQMRELARVASLVDRMACLCNTPLHVNIHRALHRHQMDIYMTQARCKEGVGSMSKHKQRRAHFPEDQGALCLAIALKNLAVSTRKICVALWCALQMTLPKPVKRQEHHVNKEPTQRESSSSPFHGYCFKLTVSMS